MEEIAIVRCLQNASGAISKMRVLQAFKDVENFRKILYYALNPMLTYKISEQTLRTPVEYDPAITITMTDIFEICELLAKRKALDAATVYQVRVFVQCLTDPESSEFYIELLSKTLRLGVTAKTVNKVVIVLVLIWFCLSFAFKGVGGVGMRLYNDAKKEISEETEKKTDEEKEVKE